MLWQNTITDPILNPNVKITLTGSTENSSNSYVKYNNIKDENGNDLDLRSHFSSFTNTTRRIEVWGPAF